MYTRVIPRDLFNESKLLKCLGQLALIIHDGNYPLFLEHDDGEHKGFFIEQDFSMGDLYCSNLYLYHSKNMDEIPLYSTYNSKLNYPLYFVASDETECYLFDEVGQFSADFLTYVERLSNG